MKNRKIAVALSLGLVALGLCWAGSEPWIRWEWRNADTLTVMSHDGSHARIELGLRQDGVVVWREITNTTNSPAEIPIVYMSAGWTNIIITNKDLIYREWDNGWIPLGK